MAYYFFTELDKLKSVQAAGYNFGPLNINEFQLTTLHEPEISNEELLAFAVCKGKVRYQYQNDDDNSSAVSVVLKPEGLDFNGIPIRYIIYRNLLKNSILDGDNIKSDLGSKSIYSTIYDNIKTTDSPIPQKKHLGFLFRSNANNSDFLRNGSDSIDTIFYDDSQYTAVTVEAGTTLGKFSSEKFGIEIILDGQIFEPNLELVRNVSLSLGNRINLSSLNNEEKKIEREKILQYLDPCAFYGMCFQDGVNVSSNTILKKNDLYSQILTKFTNKNRVYIDIRNENNLSLNFYENYGTGKIRLKCDKLYQNDLQSSDEIDYCNLDGWPLHIIEKLNNPNANFYHKHVVPIRISLPTSANTSNHNSKQLVYLASTLTNKIRLNRNKKLIPKLKKYPIRIHGKSKFINQKISETAEWTNQLALATFNNNTNSYNPICTYNKIIYIRQYSEQPQGTTKIINTNHHFDNLFLIKPLNNFIKWTDISKTQWWLTGNEKYIEIKYNQITELTGIAKTGVAVDESRIIFFANLYNINDGRVMPKLFSVTNGNHPTKGSFFESVFRNKNNDPQVLKPKLFEFNETIKTISLEQVNANGYVEESLIALCFTKIEFSQLIEPILSNFSNYHPVYFKLANIATTLNSVFDNFCENYTANLLLIGYDNSGNTKVLPIYANPAPSTELLTLNSVSNELIFSTIAAANSENLPINTFSDFDISDQNHTNNEIIALKTALNDIKKYNPFAYYTLREYIRYGKRQIFFANKIINGAIVSGNSSPLSRVRVSIIFDTPDGTENHISMDADADISTLTPRKNTYLNTNNNDWGSRYGIEGSSYGQEYSHNPNLYRKYNDLYHKQPSKIEEELFEDMQLKCELRDSSNGKLIQKYSDGFISFREAENIGFGAFEENQTITIRVNRTSYIGWEDSEIGVYLVNFDSYNKNLDKLPLYTFGNWAEFKSYATFSIIPPLSGFSFDSNFVQRNVQLALSLAHEFCHAIYQIQNPLRDYIWSVIEIEYKENPNVPPPNSTTLPFYPRYGGGHIRGNGTGNLSYKHTDIFYNNIKKYLLKEINERGPDNMEVKISPTNILNLSNFLKRYNLPTYKEFSKYYAKDYKQLPNNVLLQYPLNERGLHDGINNFDI